MFNFDIKPVFEKKHIIVDDLLRQFQKSLNNINKIHKKDIDDFIDEQFNCVHVYSVRVNEKENKQFLKNEYSKNSQKVARYFIILF